MSQTTKAVFAKGRQTFIGNASIATTAMTPKSIVILSQREIFFLITIEVLTGYISNKHGKIIEKYKLAVTLNNFFCLTLKQ